MPGADGGVVLLRLRPHREDGGAGKEVGAGPTHAGFLFVARSADLEFSRSHNTHTHTHNEKKPTNHTKMIMIFKNLSVNLLFFVGRFGWSCCQHILYKHTPHDIQLQHPILIYVVALLISESSKK